MSSWLVPIASLSRRRGEGDARVVGGKAARLAWLVKHGFRVPEAWVLPVDAFREALRLLPPGCEPRSLLRVAGRKLGAARAAEARAQLLEASLPSGLADELAALVAEHGDRARWGFAVRSSATCEDGALASMAGLAESVLGVRDAEGMAGAIRAVWASIASAKALAYLAVHGVRDVAMAVVIQRVVEADAAGVLFTRAPNADASRVYGRVVNAGRGLGVSVVDGVATPDVLRIDERGRLVEAIIAHKPRATVIDESGLSEVAVEQPDAPALSAARLEELAEIALRLERIEPIGYDVEFACDREVTWLVQVRPATGRGFPEGGDATTVWSAANVGEALPGVATPLTWSIAGAFSESGFRHAFAALGCHVPRSARLIASVHGRFYLNLTEFMRIAAQVPWLDPRTLVELGGGAGGDELAVQTDDVSRKGFLLRLPGTAARLARDQLRLSDRVTQFEAYAEDVCRLHNALDLAILPDEAVGKKLRDVQAVLERTGALMLSVASAALGSHLVLTMLLRRVSPLSAERLAQSLTSGIRDLESARPAMAIHHVATLARREPDARQVLESEATTGLDALPDGATRRALQSFLALYGDRAVREAELSTPRWREDPRMVLTMLRVALRGEGKDLERALGRARSQAADEMQRLVPRLGLVEQTLVRHVVARAQTTARLRERMRAWVTRVLGMIRDVALEAQRRLLRRDGELRADEQSLVAGAIQAVFFLTADEVVAALDAPAPGLVAIVRARRAEFARDIARPDPPVTFVGAPPPVVLPPSGGEVLRGLPASAGVVEGLARVLHGAGEMGELEPGEILVVHTTDVGWTPLFLLAAGVVTDLGGPLSHAAIVARELGVPSVVNVTGATRALRTGDRLRVDGDRGVVERIARA